MTDQLEELPPPEPSVAMSRTDRIKSEIVAGGSAEEVSDDELAGGWKGALAMAGIAASICGGCAAASIAGPGPRM